MTAAGTDAAYGEPNGGDADAQFYGPNMAFTGTRTYNFLPKTKASARRDRRVLRGRESFVDTRGQEASARYGELLVSQRVHRVHA
jgi:hypothetical protein